MFFVYLVLCSCIKSCSLQRHISICSAKLVNAQLAFISMMGFRAICIVFTMFFVSDRMPSFLSCV